MADIGVFPASLETALESPTAALVELAKFVFGDGEGGTITRRFHAGAGNITVEGEVYEGVTDPAGIRVVEISPVELPTAQVAAKVDITISYVDKTFAAQVRAERNVIYGAEAEIYECVFDTETYQPITSPVLIFDNGRCGYPRFAIQGNGLRAITIPIDGVWSSKNYEPGGRINNADQTQRYPGDRGFELVGSPAFERIK